MMKISEASASEIGPRLIMGSKKLNTDCCSYTKVHIYLLYSRKKYEGGSFLCAVIKTETMYLFLKKKKKKESVIKFVFPFGKTQV